MKTNAATLSSFLRSASTAAILLLLPLLLIGWAEEGLAHPVNKPMSPVLHSQETYTRVQEVAQHAQSLQEVDDTDIRLSPRVNTSQDEMKICCLHANILDFYLNNILHHHKSAHPHMHKLETDLTRVSKDLQKHGCNVTHYHDHHHAVEFRQKLNTMEHGRGIIKAVGEVDILFTYLQDFCVVKKNAAAA
ncbi:interleukin-22 [Cheilinus undulatus]|uniref:interleukin-22 n=1 Tax=Cheilinus undulatus TaxID=241271 RepID=UPI001BD1C4BE|nr:interleukin-22 [Cheilinus undulatus]